MGSENDEKDDQNSKRGVYVSPFDKLLGGFNWYILLICLVPTLVKIPSGINATISVFILPKIDYRCKTCFDDIPGLNYTEYENSIEELAPTKDGGKCGAVLDKCQIESYVFPNTSMTNDQVYNPDIAECCFPENGIYSPEQCSSIPENYFNDTDHYVTCNEYVYDHSRFKTTATEDYNYVCSNSWLLDLAASIYFAGFMTGGILNGIVADIIGRKPCIIFCCAGIIASNIIHSFSTSSFYFMTFRFINGFFTNGMMVPGYALCMELIPSKYRSWQSMAFSGLFAVGIMLTSYPYAVLFDEWRPFQLWICLFAVPPLVGMFWVPESYKWLVSLGRGDEAFDIAQNIMKKNKSSVCGSDYVPTTEEKEQLRAVIDEQIEIAKGNADADLEKVDTQKTRANGLDLFRNKHLLPVTLNLSLNWFTCSLVYYGLGLNAGNLPGSDIFNNFMNGLFEVPAYFTFPYFIDWKKWGRKGTSAIFLILGALFCLSSTIVLELAPCDNDVSAEADSKRYLNTVGQVLAYIGKYCYSGTFVIAYTYTAEFYPAEIRSNGVAICSGAARVAGILTPFILGLSDIYTWLPGVIFSVLGVVSGICTFFLPETLGKPLLSTLEQTEKVYFNK